MKDMTVAEYIDKYYDGVRVDFANAQGVQAAQVSAWLKQEIIVRNHKMYYPEKLKRELDLPPKANRRGPKK